MSESNACLCAFWTNRLICINMIFWIILQVDFQLYTWDWLRSSSWCEPFYSKGFSRIWSVLGWYFNSLYVMQDSSWNWLHAEWCLVALLQSTRLNWFKCNRYLHITGSTRIFIWGPRYKLIKQVVIVFELYKHKIFQLKY